MGLRKIRRRFQKERQSAVRRFRKQKRLNLLASPGRHPFIIVLDHLKPFFNIGKIFRSADAFGASEVHFDKDRYPGIKSLKIHQVGKVESLNVSIAASIVMYEYNRQHGSGF